MKRLKKYTSYVSIYNSSQRVLHEQVCIYLKIAALTQQIKSHLLAPKTRAELSRTLTFHVETATESRLWDNRSVTRNI